MKYNLKIVGDHTGLINTLVEIGHHGNHGSDSFSRAFQRLACIIRDDWRVNPMNAYAIVGFYAQAGFVDQKRVLAQFRAIALDFGVDVIFE